MRIFFIGIMFLAGLHTAAQQKKEIGFEDVRNWPSFDDIGISDNGLYVCYTLHQNKKNSLVVSAIDGKWKKVFPGCNSPKFTGDGRWLIFNTLTGDSLGLYDIDSNECSFLHHVNREFEVFGSGKDQWLVYRQKEQADSLSLLNFASGKTLSYSGIKEFQYSNRGRVLVMSQEKKDTGGLKFYVLWVQVNSGTTTIIGTNQLANSFTFDHTGKSIAYLVSVGESGPGKGLYYYKPGMDSAVNIIDLSAFKKNSLSVEQIEGFDKKDENLSVFIKKNDIQTDQNNKGLTISSYRYGQVTNKRQHFANRAIVQLNNHNTVAYLQTDDDNHVYVSSVEAANNDYALVCHNGQDADNNAPDIYLVSTKDGSRILLKRKLMGPSYNIDFSRAGKFVMWFDMSTGHWYTYNIHNRRICCITEKIHSPLTYEKNGPAPPNAVGIAGWLDDDHAVLIYDRYDVWQVDPNGIINPVNVTHGYGLKNNVVLRCLDFNKEEPAAINEKDTLLLWGWDLNKKYNYFYRLSLAIHPTLEVLSGGSKVYCYTQNPKFTTLPANFYPIKAKETHKYLCRGMTAEEYPNLYMTGDFKVFFPLTNLQPQKQYNWYKTELIHWHLPEGNMESGILYKPEDFTPSKKYPIIFYYYEECSDGLNFFLFPHLCTGPINIPWFVSHGYLVFVADIHFKVGYPGFSAYNSVVSAARYLSKLPYVDKLHMGLQGHSFGGFETNYILTRTNLFAAACSASAMVNLTDAYLHDPVYYEEGQGRMGATLWDRPDLYTENSAIFKADKVNTPLLIFHNKNDGSVPFSQAEQWFNGLSRLGKKVWMLSYANGNHTLMKEEDEKDYTIRLTQFFDYYLKKLNPPQWMTKGTDNLGIDEEPKAWP